MTHKNSTWQFISGFVVQENILTILKFLQYHIFIHWEYKQYFSKENFITYIPSSRTQNEYCAPQLVLRNCQAQPKQYLEIQEE